MRKLKTKQDYIAQQLRDKLREKVAKATSGRARLVEKGVANKKGDVEIKWLEITSGNFFTLREYSPNWKKEDYEKFFSNSMEGYNRHRKTLHCRHREIFFTSGGYRITCNECGAIWTPAGGLAENNAYKAISGMVGAGEKDFRIADPDGN